MINKNYTWVKSNKSIEDIIEKNREYCFLAGSGISLDSPSMMPTGFQVTKQILENVIPEDEIISILELTNPERDGKRTLGDFLRFEQLMGFLRDYDPELHFLDLYADCDRPNFYHCFLAKMSNLGKKVFTTNFDSLIEYAFNKMGIELDNINPIIYKDDWEDKSLHNNAVFKLHGSFKNITHNIDTRDSLQATLEQISSNKGESFILEDYKYDIFAETLKEHDIIVLGYSGLDDFDVMPTLLSIPSDRSIIWVQHEGDLSLNNSILQELKEDEIEKKNNQRSGSQLLKFPERGSRLKDQIFHLQINCKHFIEFLNNHFSLNLTKNILDSPPSAKPTIIPYIQKYLSLSTLEKWLLASQIYYFRGLYDKALSTYTKALDIAHKKNDTLKIAQISTMIGVVKAFLGDFDTALDLFKKSEGKFEEIQDPNGKFATLNDVGMIYTQKGYFEKALEIFRSIESLFPKFDERNGMLFVNIGTCLQNIGQLSKSLDYYDDAITISEKFGNLNVKATSLLAKGQVYNKLNNITKALNLFNKANDLFHTIGDLSKCIDVYNNIGLLYFSLNDFMKAELNFQEALKLAEQINSENQKGMAFQNLGSIMRSRGNLEAALTYYNKAIHIFEKLGGKFAIIETKSQIAELFIIESKIDEALELLKSILNTAKEFGSIVQISNLSINIARLYGEQKKFLKMHEVLKDTYELVSDFNDDNLTLTTLDNIILITQSFDSNENVQFYQEKLDNLREKLPKKEDRIFSLWNKASNLINNKDINLALITLEKALELAKENNDHRMKCLIFNSYAEIYLIKKNITKALNYLTQAHNISKTKNFPSMSLQTLMKKASILNNDERFKEAIEAYEEALNVSLAINNYNYALYSTSFLGFIFGKLKKYQKGLEYFFKSLKYSKQLKNKIGESIAYGAIASFYKNLNEYEEAEAYYYKELEIQKELGDISQQAKTYFLLGNLLRKNEKFEKSNTYYFLSLELAKRVPQSDLKREADIYMYSADNFKKLQKYQKAINYYLKASEIFDELGLHRNLQSSFSSIIYCYGYLSDALFEQDNFKESFETIEKALTFYDKNPTSEVDKEYLFIKMINICNHLDDDSLLLDYINEAIEFSRNCLKKNSENSEIKEYLSMFLMELVIYQDKNHKQDEPEKFYGLIDEIIHLRKEQNNLKQLWNAHFYGFKYAIEQKDIKNMKFYADKAIEILNQLGKYNEIIQLTSTLARTAKELLKKDISLKYYKIAQDYCSKIRDSGQAYLHFVATLEDNDNRVIAHHLLLELRDQLNENNYDGALGRAMKVLDLLKPYGDSLDKGAALYQLGNIFWAQNKFDDSLKYLKKAYKVFINSKNFTESLITNQNIIKYYKKVQDEDSALLHYKQRIDLIGEDSRFFKDKAYTYGFIGQIYHKNNEIKIGNEYYEKAAQVFEILNDENMASKARKSKK